MRFRTTIATDYEQTVVMEISAENLRGRWRRIDRGIDGVRAAMNSPDIDVCSDAVAGALAFTYDLWECLGKLVGTDRRGEVSRADVAGRVTGALIFARGEVTHNLIEPPNENTDTCSDTFYEVYGVWRWQDLPISDDPRLKRRSEWYRDHVCGEELIESFEAASSWLRARPELSVSTP